MLFTNSKSIILLFTIFFILLFSQINLASEDWRPITSQELAMKNGKVEVDADAEAIFWEIKIDDEYVRGIGYQSILKHYIRIKIFTEKGREGNSKVQIPFGNLSSARVSITDIAARTTKLDGTQIFLDEKDIFEQEIAKGDDLKVKAKSFVVPGIETGAIIEYQWKESRRDAYSYVVRLHISRELPLQNVKFWFSPVTYARFPYLMRIQTFNSTARLAKESDGLYSMTGSNVRSYKKEPYMPPEYSTRPWLLIYYENADVDTGLSQDKYWSNKGKATYKYHDSIYKNKSNIKSKALEVVGDVTDPLEKVKRIFYFCRTNIKNVNDDALGLTPEEREKIKENKNESDTLKRGQGTWHDINMLFAAMLNSVDLEVRIGNVGLRTNPPLNTTILNDYLFRSETVAVKINNEWQFFEPSLSHLPFGLLSWTEEGQAILISDKDEPVFARLPFSSADQSNQKRIINAKLDENGTLEADVRIEYTGHLAQIRKESLDEESELEKEKYVVEMVKNQISDTTEVSDIVIENIEDPEKPLVYKFKIKSLNYAQRTGKRYFVKPNIFANNIKSRFSSSTRQNNIFFRYAWSEIDQVNIEIPIGFTLETSDPLKAITDSNNIGSHSASIKFDPKTGILNYTRAFSFGKKGEIEFEATSYSIIKKLFDLYENADQYAVTLLVN